MEDYNKWNIEDFVDDESFNNYALITRAFDVEKWDGILEQNPQLKPMAEKAGRMIILLSKAQKPHVAEVDSRLRHFWFRISLLEQHGINKKAFTPYFIKKAILYAAVVVLVLSLGLNLNSYVKSFYSKESGLCTTIVGKGQKSEVVLPDGTKVWLNSESELTYPVNFSKKNRMVSLVGEGYFRVTHDSRHPFLVNASDVRIKVYGTEFNVKCYKNEDIIETTLVNGSVSITQENGKEVFLKPSQKFLCYKGSDNSDKSHSEASTVQNKVRTGVDNLKKIKSGELLDNIDTYSATAWKEHKLIFENETFADIAVKIERWYDVKVVFQSEKIKQFRYRGSFENETVEQAIQALTLATPFNYRFDKRTIYIKD